MTTKIHPTIAAHRARCAQIALKHFGLEIGDTIEITTRTRHIAEGCRAQIERIDLSFTRGRVSSYRDEDYTPANIELSLVIGARSDGTATLRFRLPAKQVTPC